MLAHHWDFGGVLLRPASRGVLARRLDSFERFDGARYRVPSRRSEVERAGIHQRGGSIELVPPHDRRRFRTSLPIQNSNIRPADGVTQILIPAGYHTAFSGEALDIHEEGKSLLSMSRGIAVVLIGVYLGALAFQMFTHEHLYGSLDAREGREQRTRKAFGRQLLNPARSTGSYQGAFKLDGTDAEKQESSEEDVDVRPVVVPELNLWFAIVILLLLLGCTFPLLSWSHADENYSPRDELALFRRSSAERGYSQPLHFRRVGRSHYNPDLRQLFGATRFHHFLGSGSGTSPLPIEIELT